MPLPESLMNMLLAPKIRTFFENLINELNKRFA